ncbi:MAG TPA: SDR family oxidoreductase [Saprospiraceae bacterium]|nr:SDR family oxidoreductase [Saprospiraceae bacterium]
MNHFNNKKVLITGASSGIGEAFSIAFNQQGAHVLLVSRNQKELERVQKRLNPQVPSTIYLFDVAQYHEAHQFIQDVLAYEGTIDILVNNAGVSQRSLALETSFDDEKKILDVNLYGVLALTKACMPEIIKNKGQVVVISSVMGKINTKYRSAYAASKHAIIGYFDCLRLEVEDYGVNIINIIPGYIATNITKNAVGSTEDIIQNSENNKGLTPDRFAQKAIDAISKRKKNVYIGGLLEGFAIKFKMFAPNLFDKFIKNKKVT